jgi:hypothetical protein
VKRIVCEIAAIPGALSPLESRTGIGASESLNSDCGQVLGLRQLAFVAIRSESTDPLKVNHLRSGTKIAFSPPRKNRAFAVISRRHSFAHEPSDASIRSGVEVLSRSSRTIHCAAQALRAFTLDIARPKIMRLILISR